MDVATGFIEIIKQCDLKFELFHETLEYANDSQLLTNISASLLHEVISKVNVKLDGSPEMRVAALRCIQSILTQCSHERYSDHLLIWMHQCTRRTEHVKLELTILRELIEKSVAYPDMKKTVSGVIIPKFIERLTDENSWPKIVQLTLKCIKSFCDNYGTSCGIHHHTMYEYVMKQLYHWLKDEGVVQKASRCIAALCHCGSKEQYGIAWTKQFSACFRDAHSILRQLYMHHHLLSRHPKEKQQETIVPIMLNADEYVNGKPIHRFTLLRNKFNAVVKIIHAMLLCEFASSKCFETSTVLNLICDAHSVTAASICSSQFTNDLQALLTQLPYIHAVVFDLLNALILCAGRNLIPYGTLICKICVHSLVSTSPIDWKYGFNKPNLIHWLNFHRWALLHLIDCLKEDFRGHGNFVVGLLFRRLGVQLCDLQNLISIRMVRRKAYCTLLSWQRISCASSCLETFADSILPIIISDVDYHKPVVKLTINDATKKSKKRKYFSSEINLSSESTVYCDKFANKEICRLAHDILQALFNSSSVFLKWEHHKQLQMLTITKLLEIQKANFMEEYPVPYADAKCRLALYETLFALISNPHPQWCNPISYAVHIINAAANDYDPHIKFFSKSSLRQIESIIHPMGQSLLLFSVNEDAHREHMDEITGIDEEPHSKDTASKKMVQFNEKLISPLNGELETNNISSEEEKSDILTEPPSKRVCNNDTTDTDGLNVTAGCMESNDVRTDIALKLIAENESNSTSIGSYYSNKTTDQSGEQVAEQSMDVVSDGTEKRQMQIVLDRKASDLLAVTNPNKCIDATETLSETQNSSLESDLLSTSVIAEDECGGPNVKSMLEDFVDF